MFYVIACQDGVIPVVKCRYDALFWLLLDSNAAANVFPFESAGVMTTVIIAGRS